MKPENRRIAIIILSIITIGAVVYFFSDIFAYIIIAWILSMIGEPLMKLFMKIKIPFIKGRKLKLGRTGSSMLTLLSFVIGFALLIGIFVPLIAEQASNLANVQYDQIYETLQEPINRISKRLMASGLFSADQLSPDMFRNTLSDLFKPSFISDLVSNIFSLAGNVLIGVFSILFITFFFLKEENLFSNFILALVPDNLEDETLVVLEDISKMLRKYFGGIILQISIITILVTLGLSILGVENALLIGFFAGVINVIPYVGPIIGALFGILITISSNLNVEFYEVLAPLILKVVGVFAAMQLTDNFILQPFIYSNSVKAHPLEIFIIILLAAKLGGILGMILAIPAYTVMRVIAKEFFYQFKFVQKITNSLE